MSKKASCKCKSAECEECPEWIFTFADLVMLMMGFFVILWVLKPTGNPQVSTKEYDAQTQDWLETVGQIRAGFGWEADPKSSDPVDQAILRRRSHNGPGERGKTLREIQGATGTDPEVTTIRAGKQTSVGGRLIFQPGSAALDPDMTQALNEIAQQIRGHRNIVLIKGHASRDDFPDGTPAEKSMDLSLRRAQAVADYLTSRGVEPEILRVQGCSTFEPVSQRAYTSAAQSVNRRVEVEATATLVDDLQDRSTGRPTTASTEHPRQ